MTLEEYIDQPDPQRNLTVELDRSEITIGATIKIAGHPSLTQIWITDGYAKICWGIQYVKKEDDSCLFTSDADGNPDKRSCFHYNGSTQKRII